MSVMRSARTATGFVYVISATNGYVKIGKARNPYERFTDHQSSSPLVLTLCYVCACANPVDIEVAAHEALAARRKHREWFDVPADLAIDAVRAALIATGAQTMAAPHRSSRAGPRTVLRSEICETAIL